MPTNERQSTDRITRRRFLKGAAAAAGCLAISTSKGFLPHLDARDQTGPDPVGRPGTHREAEVSPRVAHVHSSVATSWDYATGWYGHFVNQQKVNQMVDRGLMALTGEDSPAAAWQALIPGYLPGQRVAIKVNLNNAWSADDSDNIIDALIEPVNRVIAGLKGLGVAESDIWVYDAVRLIPNRFRNRCLYPGVRFSGLDLNPQGFSATEKVIFEPPPGNPSLLAQGISQVLVNATYLINMPIMKKHYEAYVTLSFKNHFGSIENCSQVHGPTFPHTTIYRPDYNPLVDIYCNTHFVDKTVLTIGDGLYASRGNQSTRPDPWNTFGGQAPNSLFFSRDPVAIDCVMYDFLEAEAGVPDPADDYLALAAGAGLGIFEHRAPGASGPEDWYSLIDYVYVDLDSEPSHYAYVPLVRR